MKKLLPVALVVVVLAVGAYFVLGRKGENTGVSLPGKEEVFEGTLKTAVEKGVPLKCEWKQDAQNYGTSWVKGEKIYTEATANGESAKLLFKDNCVWSWNDSGEGTKFCTEEVNYDDLTGTTDYEGTTPVDSGAPEDMGVDYNCSPAVITDSKFDEPSGVNFVNPLEGLENLNLENFSY